MPPRAGAEALLNKIHKELGDARKARMNANEGRARVCARRAAGWAIAALNKAGEGGSLAEANAYRYLQWFEQQERYPEQLRHAAARLTTRVDKRFALPFAEDPLDDAESIVRWVFSRDVSPDSGRSNS